MSRLYRILIVEDEQIERSALTMMIKYNRSDIQEIRTAANGGQALEEFRAFLPDIVFMDINLPGINGLDVIRQMKLVPGVQPRFVVVSAHSQFAYAQEAMRLDVQDFLVKPISLEDITGVLDSLTREIDQSRSQKERAVSQQEKFNAIRPVLESDCVLSVASLRSTTPIATIFDFMQISVTSGFVFILRGEGVGGVLLPEVKARMRNMGIHCIGEMIRDDCVCIALSSQHIRPWSVQEMMQHLSNTFSRSGLTVSIGVGGIANHADDLRRSYEQAMASIRTAAQDQAALPDGEDNVLSAVAEEAAGLCHSIRMGSREAVGPQVHGFFDRSAALPREKLWEQAYWMYVMVVSSFTEYASGLQPLSAERILAIRDRDTLEEVLTRSFETLAQFHDSQDSGQSNQLVARTIRIVRQQFRQDLTLDSVAEELNVSLFYLSKLFRKHTGVTFTEFLTQTRIDHAKQLLSKEEMSVKEVAYATGFNSQGYFSKIFKKYTGFAPSEYREDAPPAETGSRASAGKA
ncbi:MAG: helix-turn-helix domain-containing protein [Eubacteriales bacterium]|nr:helix-turn-helix domain-containing protein [Eubacteriales bacterium]